MFLKYQDFLLEQLIWSVSIDDVLRDINFIEIDFYKHFEIPEQHKKDSLLETLSSSWFLEILNEKDLKSGPLHRTEEEADLVKEPIDWAILFQKGTQIDVEQYLILQKDENSPIRMFVSENNNFQDFFRIISSKIITITKPNESGKRWIYKSTNAGENWFLQNLNQATEEFPKMVYGEDIREREQKGEIKIRITD